MHYFTDAQGIAAACTAVLFCISHAFALVVAIQARLKSKRNGVSIVTLTATDKKLMSHIAALETETTHMKQLLADRRGTAPVGGGRRAYDAVMRTQRPEVGP